VNTVRAFLDTLLAVSGIQTRNAAGVEFSATLTRATQQSSLPNLVGMVTGGGRARSRRDRSDVWS
jgi:hypothetical protein